MGSAHSYGHGLYPRCSAPLGMGRPGKQGVLPCRGVLLLVLWAQKADGHPFHWGPATAGSPL